MRTTIPLLVTALLAAAAAPAFAQYYDTSILHGRWQWLLTQHPRDVIETPASAGHTVQIEFTESGGFTRYHDYRVVETGSWYVGEVETLIHGRPVPVEALLTDRGDVWYYWRLTGDEYPGELMFQFGDYDVRSFSFYDSLEMVPAAGSTWGGVKGLYR